MSSEFDPSPFPPTDDNVIRNVPDKEVRTPLPEDEKQKNISQSKEKRLQKKMERAINTPYIKKDKMDIYDTMITNNNRDNLRKRSLLDINDNYSRVKRIWDSNFAFGETRNNAIDEREFASLVKKIRSNNLNIKKIRQSNFTLKRRLLKISKFKMSDDDFNEMVNPTIPQSMYKSVMERIRSTPKTTADDGEAAGEGEGEGEGEGAEHSTSGELFHLSTTAPPQPPLSSSAVGGGTTPAGGTEGGYYRRTRRGSRRRSRRRARGRGRGRSHHRRGRYW